MLYTAIAAYIEQGTANEKGKELVKTYNEHAVAFFVVGHSLSIRTGKSEENIKKQTMMLLEYYQNEILSGKLLNNDSITALVGSDMKSANEAFPFFEALYADILKEQNADKTKP